MNRDELLRLFDGMTTAFRLEQHQVYAVPQEADAFAAFKAGRPLPTRTPETSPWLARLVDDAAAGRRWYRVRVIEHPLTDYTRFELIAYRGNAAAGEEVYVAERALHPALDELREDFWLLDDQRAVRMLYDDEGRFLGSELAPDDQLAEYRRRRDVALHLATPLDEHEAAGQQRSA